MEADQGKKEQVRRNPLEIPEILEKVLECLPLKDLKASRLVSKLWRDCGISPMKKKSKNTVWLNNDKTINDLAELTECLNSVAGGYTNFPCSKVFVDASLVGQNKKNRRENEVIFANFLQKISPWVTVLELTTNLRKTITANAFPLSLNFPKLKLLEVTSLSYGITRTDPSKGSAKNFYRFVTSILERAPSLRKVEISNVGYHSVDVTLSTIKARRSSFTELKINAVISNSSLEKLSKWNGEIKLKSVELMFVKSEDNSSSLFQFLRSQSDSLETLVLYVSRISSPIVVIFPEMPKLKSLTINVFIDYNDDDENEEVVTFPVISYQRQFPALKVLHLNPWNCEAMSLCKQFIKQEMPPVETIEELSLPRSEFEDESLLTAQNAVRIFPNVKKLNMAADRAMLPTIFKHWTGLEQITLCYKKVPARSYGFVNHVLMGQTRSEYKRLRKRIKRAGKDFDWNRLEPGNAEESIVNLQKLRVLRFENEMESRELEVDRAPLHLILRQIRSLRCVHFGAIPKWYPIDQTEIDKAWWADLNEDCVVLWNHI